MRGLEKNCTRWRKQTDRHTDGHGDSMTNSTQWGRVGENSTSLSGIIKIKKNYMLGHKKPKTDLRVI